MPPSTNPRGKQNQQHHGQRGHQRRKLYNDCSSQDGLENVPTSSKQHSAASQMTANMRRSEPISNHPPHQPQSYRGKHATFAPGTFTREGACNESHESGISDVASLIDDHAQEQSPMPPEERKRPDGHGNGHKSSSALFNKGPHLTCKTSNNSNASSEIKRPAQS